MVRKVLSKFRSSPSNPLIVFFLILGAITYALNFAQRNQYVSISPEIVGFIDAVFFAAITFLIASITVRLSGHLVLGPLDDGPLEQRLLARKLYIGVVYFFAVAFLLWKVGATVESLTVMLGLVAGGLAFTLREILISYWVWFMLLKKKPFRIGDYIRIGEDEGIVKHIGTFYVMLDDTLASDDDFTRIPNKLFTEKPVLRLGREEIRVSVSVPVPVVKEMRANLAKAKAAVSDFTLLSGPMVVSTSDKVSVSCSALVPALKAEEMRNELFLRIHEAISHS